MPGRTERTIRKVQTSRVADFDDQLWPINCAILILAGFVAGIVIATSDFDDPRILYNTWFRLATVVLAVGLLFWAVVWLQGKMVRRVQFCVLVSLLVHLWLAMYLHEQYLALMAQREAEASERVTEQYERITVPDYHWEHVERPEKKQVFQEPVETEVPKETEPEPVEQEERERDVPTEKEPTAEPEAPQRQQPNPAEIRRAELTAPRRAEKAAGGQISRQQWKHRPEPNEPVPEPEIKPQGQNAASAPAANVATVERQQIDTPGHQRQTFETEPGTDARQEVMKLARRATQSKPLADVPTTPKPTRQMIRPAELARTQAAAPRPVPATEQPRPAEPQPTASSVARRLTETPTQRLQTTEPAPTLPKATARTVARQQRPARRPEFAQTPERVPSRQPRTAALPTDVAVSQPQVTGAASAQPSALRPVDARVDRKVAAVSPDRSSARTAEVPSAGGPATVARSQPRRADRKGGAIPQAESAAPGRIARRTAPAAEVASARIAQPTAAPVTAAGTPSGSATGPSSTAVGKAGDTWVRAARQPTPGRELPAMASAARLPAAMARRATASQQEPGSGDAAPSVPGTLARSAAGVNLPSAALPSESEVLRPAAAGGGPATRVEATGKTAVARSSTRAPSGKSTAAAGVAEFAVGSTRVAARAGQPRAAGRDQPSVAANSRVPRIARALAAGTSRTAIPGPAIAPAPAAASASSAGGPRRLTANAQATAAARGGSTAPPSSQPNTGSGRSGSRGAPGRVGVAQLARVTRHESVPSAFAGGGVPQPARTPGRALAPEAKADVPQVATAVPSGGSSDAGSPLEAQVGGQQRQVAGLPGSRESQSAAAGAVAALTRSGTPLPAAAARRATASQLGGAGSAPSPGKTITLARAKTGTNLPIAAVPLEDVPGTGAAGMAAAQGGLTSKLEAGSATGVQRTAAGTPIGRRTIASGSVEFAAGSAPVVALAGQVRAGGEGVPTLATNAAARQVGRAVRGEPVLSTVAGEVAEPTPDTVAGGPGTGPGGPPQPGANASATAATRGGQSGLPVTGPAAQAGPAGGAAGGSVAAVRLARAGGGERMPAVPDGTGIAGPTRTVGRMVPADLVAKTPELAATGRAPGGRKTGAPGAELEASAVGEPRQAAGLPGKLSHRMPVDSAVAAGPASTTPGVTSGPRRLPQGEGQGPSLAAEVGGGPLRKTNMPGLPRGLADTAEEQPLAKGGQTAEPRPLEVAAGLGFGEPGRRAGGLPVQIAAVAGPGGLSYDPSPEVGIPSRRARPESEVIHTVSRRFVVERSGGRLAIDGRVRERPTEAFRQRDPGRRGEIAKTFGGTEGTEKAVEMGLDFFARFQFPDGHWSLHELPETGEEYEDFALGQMESDSAATGLSLLTYFGAGYTHLDDKHRAVVRRGLDWLVRNQKKNGDLFTGGTKPAWFYSHGIAAIALCEGYGMTRDPQLREPAQKAIQFIVDSQHPTRGGWRYKPQQESDTSVSGWQLMAMKSAQMAGLEVPAETLKRVSTWLDQAQHAGGARYAYNPYAKKTPEQREGLTPNLAMTAEGLLMRMYEGWQRDNPALIEGAEYLKAALPEVGTEQRPLRDVYYWYYATQVMFQMQGEYWSAWHGRLQPLLQSSQTQRGPLAGSWHPNRPVRDRWGHAGGRLYVSAMNVLMLEVYYRHLPLYRFEEHEN